MIIEKLSVHDICKLQEVVPESWDKNLPDLVIKYYDKDYFYAVVAKEGKDIVGFGHNIDFKNTGWLGHILVKDGYKRQGIGKSIVNELIKVGKEMKTINLVATKEGEYLYRSLGFKNDGYYLFYKGIYTKEVSKNIKKIQERDIEYILDIDRKITFEDRREILNSYFKNGYKYENSKGEIEGYYLKGFGQGAVMAINSIAGIELIKFKHSIGDEITVIHEKNLEAIKEINKLDFYFYDKGMRMYYGDKLKWEKEKVFSRGIAYAG